MDKDELKAAVVALLEEVLKARFDGAAYARLSRAHGYADGYMRALQDAGLVDKNELLTLVGETRRSFVERETTAPVAVPVAASA
ncbi:MAG: hypothetical protein DRJ42_10125 [Deltaproteobacteria bacterium]|nr:MAG: hypothetical protein DRJ42_10125 [Deltaproteobacteria bacterium]